MKISPHDIVTQSLEETAIEGESRLERAAHDTPLKIKLHDPIEFLDEYDKDYERIWHNITCGNSVLGG